MDVLAREGFWYAAALIDRGWTISNVTAADGGGYVAEAPQIGGWSASTMYLAEMQLTGCRGCSPGTSQCRLTSTSALSVNSAPLRGYAAI